jgi:hypothetical protein
MSGMIFSFYNILFDADGKHYLYNTLSTALAQVDDKTMLAVKNGDSTAIDPQFIKEMTNQHFLVDCQANEPDESGPAHINC